MSANVHAPVCSVGCRTVGGMLGRHKSEHLQSAFGVKILFVLSLEVRRAGVI